MAEMYKLIHRSVLFLFFFLVSLIVFYVIGNYQLFLDVNQIIILRITMYASFALCFFSILQMIFALFFAQKRGEKKRFRFVLHFLFSLCALLCAAAVILFAASVNSLSGGIQALHPAGL